MLHLSNNAKILEVFLEVSNIVKILLNKQIYLTIGNVIVKKKDDKG